MRRFRAAEPALRRVDATARSGLRRLTRPRGAGSGPVVVLGSGRSGTTWMLQVLATLPGALPLHEPLRPVTNPRAARMLEEEGFVSVAPGASAPELEDYLRLVLEGRYLTRWSTSRASAGQWCRGRRVVAKEIRLNRAACWVTESFPDAKVLGVVRHPCAVVASMLGSPGVWRTWSEPEVLDPIRAWRPGMEPALAAARTRAGWLAAFWAADTLGLVAEPPRGRLHVVTYESLVSEPEVAFGEAFAWLDEPMGPEALDVAGRPSSTANANAAVRNRRDPLTEWSRRLSAEQQGEILEVVRAAGVHVYGDDPLPDAEALEELRGRDSGGA